MGLVGDYFGFMDEDRCGLRVLSKEYDGQDGRHGRDV